MGYQAAKGRPLFTQCADVNEYATKGHFEGQNIFGTNVWDYYVELWETRLEPNVMTICYEDLMKDKGAHLPKIAEFLGISLTPELSEIVQNMSAKEFMAACEHQFDENFLARKARELGRAVQIMEVASKVSSGSRATLSEETVAWLADNWEQKVTSRTGLASYDDFRTALCGRARYQPHTEAMATQSAPTLGSTS